MIEEHRNNREELSRLLILHNTRLVFWVAKKYYSKTNDFDEILAKGFYGLVEAAGKFDIDRGTKFSTYATSWIKKEILKEFSTKEIKKGIKMVHLFSNKKNENNSTMSSDNIISQDFEHFDPVWEVQTTKSPLESLYDSEMQEIMDKVYGFVETNPNFSKQDIDIFFRIYKNSEQIKDISSETGLSSFQINSRKRKMIKTIKRMLKNDMSYSKDEICRFFKTKD